MSLNPIAPLFQNALLASPSTFARMVHSPDAALLLTPEILTQTLAPTAIKLVLELNPVREKRSIVDALSVVRDIEQESKAGKLDEILALKKARALASSFSPIPERDYRAAADKIVREQGISIAIPHNHQIRKLHQAIARNAAASAT